MEREDEKIKEQVVYAINQLHVCECTKDKLRAWVEKQGNIDLEFFENGENEKREFVGYGFLKCKGDFLSFKEGETYWLEYIGKDNYNVRSDNLLGQTFHITPQQLYTVFRPTTWLEKQGQKDNQVKLPTFTFDDILALQCCMETVKKVQEDKELYEKLNDLHGRVYDAYQLEKQGEQKQNPYSGTSFVYNGHTWDMCGRDNGVDVSINGVIAKHISVDEIEQIYTKTAMLDCHTCANYNVKCEPEKNKFICEYPQKKSQNILEKEYYSTPKKGL